MIKLEPYNTLWPKAFADEKDQLIAVLGSEVKVEHIGSTAIPGISAKPVLIS